MSRWQWIARYRREVVVAVEVEEDLPGVMRAGRRSARAANPHAAWPRQ